MRQKILEAGTRGYVRKRRDQIQGLRKMNNPSHVGQTKRRVRKFNAKRNWMQKKPQTDQITPAEPQPQHCSQTTKLRSRLGTGERRGGSIGA